MRTRRKYEDTSHILILVVILGMGQFAFFCPPGQGKGSMGHGHVLISIAKFQMLLSVCGKSIRSYIGIVLMNNTAYIMGHCLL